MSRGTESRDHGTGGCGMVATGPNSTGVEDVRPEAKEREDVGQEVARVEATGAEAVIRLLKVSCSAVRPAII